jgi:hypothetical protein
MSYKEAKDIWMEVMINMIETKGDSYRVSINDDGTFDVVDFTMPSVSDNKIRKNIPQLRSLAAEAVKMNGGDPSNEKSITDAVGIVIQKVLERIETKFVPQLIQIYSSSTRTEDKMNTLLEVEDENLIPTIREFISKEIIKAKKDALENFKNHSPCLSIKKE